MKQTKIIATMGPASSEPKMIEQLINAGVNVFRMNFSHGTHKSHEENIKNVREIAGKLSKPIAILGDLQGPKIRVSKIENNEINLVNGDKIILDTNYTELGNHKCLGVDYKNLANDVKSGDLLLLDDGKINFTVIKIEDNSRIFCTITQGGILKSNKGINKFGGGLTAPALTDKDFEDIKFAAKHGIDYLAVSFPKDSADINLARRKLAEAGSKAQIIAKMERTEAVTHNLESIVEASDGIMIARGDLAVEVGESLVPGLQKKMIKVCHKFHKFSIVATQMLESMIESPVATRAEVSDIANAVLDGTDAVMLSAETASGKFPLQAVQIMAKVSAEAERMMEISLETNFVNQKFANIQQTIAMSALFSAYHLQAKAIIALTTSGATAKWMSRVISGIPVYAITDQLSSFNLMSMYRGVFPIFYKHHSATANELAVEACDYLKQLKLLNSEDIIIITLGDELSKIGSTNSLKVMRV